MTPCRAPIRTIRSATERRPSRPRTLDRGAEGLRIAVAGGYFRRGAVPEALAAVDRVAAGARRHARDRDPRSRAGAGGRLRHHRDRRRRACISIGLRRRAGDFDPAVRDRLIAGAMVPATLVIQAQKFRRWYREQVRGTVRWRRRHPRARHAVHRARRSASRHSCSTASSLPLRPNIGIYTQPISFIGLPVVAVPVPLTPLPIGVQIIAAPWREDVALAHRPRAGDMQASSAAPRPKSVGEAAWRSTCPRWSPRCSAAFERYEQALVTNDVATLDALFRDDPRTIRYGVAENLYGYAEIAAFRAARSPVGLARTLSRTVITTYGRDFAVASTLFHRVTMPGKVGRQMQTWVRFPEGWRVVAAHVSLIEAAGDTR